MSNIIKNIAYNSLTKQLVAMLGGGNSLVVPEMSVRVVTANIVGLTTTPAVPINFIKQGTLCTAVINPSGNYQGTKNGSTGALSFAGVIPSDMRPNSSRISLALINANGNVGYLGQCSVEANGDLLFYTDPNGTAFTASQTGCGFTRGTIVTWLL